VHLVGFYHKNISYRCLDISEVNVLTTHQIFIVMSPFVRNYDTLLYEQHAKSLLNWTDVSHNLISPVNARVNERAVSNLIEKFPLHPELNMRAVRYDVTIKP
jgi:hypothetical protein